MLSLKRFSLGCAAAAIVSSSTGTYTRSKTSTLRPVAPKTPRLSDSTLVA